MIVAFFFWSFIALCLLHLLYWCIPFGKLAFYQSPSKDVFDFPPVSIIICAKNEVDNLRQFLPLVLEQDYPDFEVILVDDGSEDGTSRFAERLKRKYRHFRCLRIDPEEKGGRIGKKYPLSRGIAASENDILLLTDADCEAKSEQWLKEMLTATQGGKTIVLGFSPYRGEETWLNRFIRFEAVYTAMQYLGFALLGQPYMGVGRNVLYHKKHFLKVGGFKNHEHIASGDDDLLVNAIANKKNTAISLEANSFMISEPKTTWKNYYRQKTRHLTAGVHYKWQHQLMLGGLSLSHFGFYVLGLPLLALSPQWLMVLFLILITTLLKFFLYKKILKKMKEEELIGHVLLLDALFVFYYLIFIPELLNGPTNRWK